MPASLRLPATSRRRRDVREHAVPAVLMIEFVRSCCDGDDADYDDDDDGDEDGGDDGDYDARGWW